MSISKRTIKWVKIVILTALIMFCFVYTATNIFKFVYEDRQVQGYADEQYIVGVYNNKIAIFSQGDNVPIEVYDVYIGTLPIKDQYELKKGIRVKGKKNLKSLIEDYTS